MGGGHTHLTLTFQVDQFFGARSAGLIKRWVSMELPGISPDCLSLLEQLRIKGCVKGEAVLTHDPEHGAFTDIEYQSLLSELNTAYENGEMEREDFLLSRLCLTLGQKCSPKFGQV